MRRSLAWLFALRPSAFASVTAADTAILCLDLGEFGPALNRRMYGSFLEEING